MLVLAGSVPAILSCRMLDALITSPFGFNPSIGVADLCFVSKYLLLFRRRRMHDQQPSSPMEGMNIAAPERHAVVVQKQAEG